MVSLGPQGLEAGAIVRESDVLPCMLWAGRECWVMWDSAPWVHLMATALHCRGLNPERAGELVLPVGFTEVAIPGVKYSPSLPA